MLSNAIDPAGSTSPLAGDPAPADPAAAATARPRPDYSNSPALSAITPTTTEFPFAVGRGVHVTDELHGPGWYGAYLTPAGDDVRVTVVVSFATWSTSFELTSGQRHRLTNALTERGTRKGIRPVASNGEFVHVSATRHTLSIDTGDHAVDLPTGPKRMLSTALTEPERFDAFRSGGLPAKGGILTIKPPEAP